MKKLFFIALAAISLMMVSCTQEPGLTLTPSQVTIKVGETFSLHPGTVGEGIDITSIKPMMEENDIVDYDRFYRVTGLKPGKAQVGICVLNDPDDPSKGLKYAAYSTITVVE